MLEEIIPSVPSWEEDLDVAFQNTLMANAFESRLRRKALAVEQ